MGRELVDIILRIVKEGKGGQEAADELKGIDKSAKKAQSGVDGLSKSWKGAMIAAAGVAGALATLKKAYDFGKEGAAISQTAESFDGLMSSMGAAPDVLGQLQAASRGTVDDMTLMSSTMTLLAGTSETMGRAIVDASPRLMEIAKAANKLNPALGTTAQMYNSIATGVKRAQPLILDNLGLTLKVGDANIAFAESIGKTVDQLTAEEKTMAILAATLEAGDRMIQQVGGSTEAAGDAYAQLETTVSNFTDELKVGFEPMVRAVVDVMNEWIDVMFKADDRVRALEDGLRETASTYGSYTLMVLDAAVAEDQLTREAADALKQHLLFGASLDETDPKLGRFAGSTERIRIKLGLMTEAEWEAIRAGRELDTTHEDIMLGLVDLEVGTTVVAEAAEEEAKAFYATADAASIMQTHMEGLVETAQEVALAEWDAASASDAFSASMDNLSMAMSGEFGDVLAEYRSELASLESNLAEGTITQDQYNESIRISTEYFQENTNAIIFNIAEKQILDALEKGLIEDMNASGTAYDEATAALWRLAEQTGLVDEDTLALMETVQEQTGAFIEGKVGVDAWALGLGNAAYQAGAVATNADSATAALGRIPNYKNIIIETTYKSTGTPPSGETGPGYTPPEPQAYQHGGQFIVRGPSGPDRVPVNFRATAGEVVTVTPVGGQAPADPSVTNNWNLTLNSAQNSQGVISDFDIMQQMAA